MHILLSTLDHQGRLDDSWIAHSVDVLNVIQSTFNYLPGSTVPMDARLRKPFGFPLQRVLGAFSRSGRSGELLLGVFRSDDGRPSAILRDKRLGVATANEMMHVASPVSEAALLLHLALRTSIQMLVGDASCPDETCILHQPVLGWPAGGVLCSDCMRLVSTAGESGKGINDALVALDRHRNTSFELHDILTAVSRDRAEDLESTLQELQPRIDVLAQRMGGRTGITADAIRRWLSQIAIASDMRCAMTLIESVLFFTLDQMVDMFDEVLPTVARRKQKTLVQFGDLGDSGSVMQYVVEHTLDASLEQLSLPEALLQVRKGERGPDLVVVDDGLFTGSQVSWVLEQLLGLPCTKTTKFATPLSDEDSETLRACNLHLVFGIAHTRGITSLKEFGKRHGLKIRVHCARLHGPASHAFGAASAIWASREQRTAARDMARRIGIEVLGSDRNYSEMTSEDRERHSLGFGDMQQLVVFSYSTPKPTVTMLWKRGRYAGQEWQPLFPPMKE